ncbi:MAG: DUF1648 domain-containing protein [Deltaproteobacteria bacterium]|nr:DUF1648 domain-containing protein [Deltaproteobacteria bacterium]
MSPKGRARLVLGLLAAAGMVQFLTGFSSMPETMATHFGPSGAADGFAPKSAWPFVQAIMLGLPLLIGLGTPELVGRIPVELVNLPNKEYWLAPERRATTLDAFREELAWFGSFMLAFMLWVTHLVFDANRRHGPLSNSGMIMGLLVMLAVTIVWCVRFFRRFRLPPG